MPRLLVLCLLVVVYVALCEGVTTKQVSGSSRRRPPGPGPSPINRVQRNGPPSRIRNLAKRAHHGPPAKRGYYPPQHRVAYSKQPFPQRKSPKFPAYNKPQKQSFSKFGAPPKGYSRPPKTSYESYSKPLSYGSYSPNSYQPKPYLPSSYQYNPPQGTAYSTQSSSSKFTNQAQGYPPASYSSSHGSHTHTSQQSNPSVAVSHSSPSSYSAPSSLSSYSSQPVSSYSVGTGTHQQAASTTYGVPHPTHGAPQPPSYASFASSPYSKDQSDQATSYVHFYQGSETAKDSQNPSSPSNTYTYSSTHYAENKHKGSVFDSDLGGSETKAWNHQDSKDKRATKKSKEESGSFKAPKQTYGFLPYDSDSSRLSDKESSYSQGYYTDSVLSPNYYEQQSTSS